MSSASDQPVVDVRSVHKTFIQQGPWPWSPKREVKAVIDVSLKVMPGEVVALVGQSGSGKTTLSRCILGLEEVTSGEILLQGQPWHTFSETQRRPMRPQYQYVPQDALWAPSTHSRPPWST